MAKNLAQSTDTIELVEWTIDGLTELFTYALLRGQGGAFHVERFEHGCAWTLGTITYSTGINGKQFASINGDQCTDARKSAQKTLDATKTFESWRVIQIEGGLSGIQHVLLYGGKRNV